MALRNLAGWRLVCVLAGGLLGGDTIGAQEALVGTPTPAFRSTITSHLLNWDGRALALVETRLAGELSRRVTVAASLRHIAGHGRSRQNRYAGRGWQFQGHWAVLPAAERRPAVTLVVDYAHERAELSYADDVSSLYAEPEVASTSVRLRTSLAGAGHPVVEVGAVQAVLNGSQRTHVVEVGGELAFPLGRRLLAEVGVSAYRAMTGVGTVSPEIRLVTRLCSSARGEVVLGGTYYPTGVPLAGAALSPGALIGAIYDSTASGQFATRPVGFLTVAVNYTW
jgi:hypothetical protein